MFIDKLVYLGSISSTFYVQLLHPQIPKAYKDTDDLTVLFTLSGPAHAKAAHRMLVKLTPGVQSFEYSDALFRVWMATSSNLYRSSSLLWILGASWDKCSSFLAFFSSFFASLLFLKIFISNHSIMGVSLGMENSLTWNEKNDIKPTWGLRGL